MPKKEKEQVSQFFAAVDEVEVNANREVVKKEPRFRRHFMAINEPRQEVNGRVVAPPKLAFIRPDEAGVYSVLAEESFFTEKMEKMLWMQKKKKYAGKIVGPFDTPVLAIAAADDARKKLPQEDNITLREEVESQKSEIDTLKEQIAELEAGSTPPALLDLEDQEPGSDGPDGPDGPTGPENPPAEG